MKVRSTLIYSPGAFGPVLARLDDDPFQWQEFALCAEIDPDLWHPPNGGDALGKLRKAAAICADCPVRIDCREYALEYEDRPDVFGSHGMFGGLMAKQRDAIRAARHRQELGAAA